MPLKKGLKLSTTVFQLKLNSKFMILLFYQTKLLMLLSLFPESFGIFSSLFPFLSLLYLHPIDLEWNNLYYYLMLGAFTNFMLLLISHSFLNQSWSNFGFYIS